MRAKPLKYLKICDLHIMAMNSQFEYQLNIKAKSDRLAALCDEG
jgi:hypothetical protein